MASPTQSPAQSPTGPPPVKGSWEDLLSQAAVLDENRNEDAISIYEKLISRLAKMPEKRRLDHGLRLQRLLETAGIRASQLLSSLDRFEEALAILQTLAESTSDEEDMAGLNQAMVRTLATLERYDESLALLAQLPSSDEFPLSELYQRFGINLDARRYDDVRQVLAELSARLDDTTYQSMRTPDELNEDRAQFHSMSSVLALELEQWDEGIQQNRRAQEFNPTGVDESRQYLYSNLVLRGEGQRALPTIEEEPLLLRRGFWKGLALYHNGEQDAARELWEESLATDVDESEAAAVVEMVLIHYYLGDPQRTGLEVILRMLREIESPSWQLFFFAALGWGTRNNQGNVLVNLDHAIDHYRRAGIGRNLPWNMWPYISDLVDEKLQSKARPYFDSEDLARYCNLSSVPADSGVSGEGDS